MVFRSRSQSRFAILTPARFNAPVTFRNVDANKRRHDELLADMQRLRGKAYEMDGAISRGELTADGRHKLSIDEHSWHVLSLDAKGEVIACLRYLEETHASGFESLRVRQAALSRCPLQGARFRRAVEREVQQARSNSIGFGEVGGWEIGRAHV